MDIELRRTTANDLPYVLAAEGDDENRRFVAVWPEEKHRAALDDPRIAHLIITAKPQSQPVGFSILAGLQDEHRSIEFMRIVVTEKGQGYGRAAVRAIKRYAFETLAAPLALAHTSDLVVALHHDAELWVYLPARMPGSVRDMAAWVETALAMQRHGQRVPCAVLDHACGGEEKVEQVHRQDARTRLQSGLPTVREAR
jgi:hypothetical protein